MSTIIAVATIITLLEAIPIPEVIIDLIKTKSVLIELNINQVNFLIISQILSLNGKILYRKRSITDKVQFIYLWFSLEFKIIIILG
jgi:hypothetical protein